MPGTIRESLKTMRRLDRAAAELNPFLTVIALGLTAVTLTYFAALAIRDALPPITRVSCPASAAASPAASLPVTSAVSRSAVDNSLSYPSIRNL
jgi:hypothetical protein